MSACIPSLLANFIGWLAGWLVSCLRRRRKRKVFSSAESFSLFQSPWTFLAVKLRSGGWMENTTYVASKSIETKVKMGKGREGAKKS